MNENDLRDLGINGALLRECFRVKHEKNGAYLLYVLHKQISITWKNCVFSGEISALSGYSVGNEKRDLGV